MSAERSITPEARTPSFQDFISKHIDLDYVYGIDPTLNLAVGRKTTDHSSMRGGNVHRQYFSPSLASLEKPFFESATLEIGDPHSILDFRVRRAGEDPEQETEAVFMGSLLEGAASISFALADSRVLARYNSGELIRIEAVKDGVGKANTVLGIDSGLVYVPDPESGLDVKFVNGRLAVTRRAEVVSFPVSVDINVLKSQLMPEEIRTDNVNVDPALDAAWAEADLLALFDVRQELIPQLR